MSYVFFFFFKQKTAYEMRISDWSSDVCSSDLIAPPRHRFKTHSQCQRGPEGRQPDTPAAFRKAKPSRNLFPHSGTAFSSNCVAAIPAQRVTTSRGEDRKSTRLNSSH